MSAKSSIKLLVPPGEPGQLYKWVALLIGSKNALKGVGFSLGGALLALLGFQGTLRLMATVLGLIWLPSLLLLKKDLGKARAKPKFRELLSKSRAINLLSAARMLLFGARDVWFVKEDGVSLDVGFYYTATALGRLLGTLLSGSVFQAYGLAACLWISSLFVLLAALISLGLPRHPQLLAAA